MDDFGLNHGKEHQGEQSSDEHEGIIELDNKIANGTDAVTALGLNDPLFEIAITPNRGDCLSLNGIARDLNVFFGKTEAFKVYEGDIEQLNLNFKKHHYERNKKIIRDCVDRFRSYSWILSID